jgi:hypothetical protein
MSNIIKHADIFSAPASVIPEFASGGFAVLSPKGSKWRIKHKGEENMITDADGDPKSTIDLVIIDAPAHISKTYYAAGYVEGSTDAPDCQSIDGTVPDPASTSPQSASCATCPHAQFGSRITPAGKKGKACSDALRLAVVPAGDILNSNFAGAMLLRVSATAIAGFVQYNDLLKSNGKSFRAVITRVGFDPDASYPKLVFKRGRDLTEDERADVIEMYSRTDALSRILSEPAQPRDDDEEQPAQAAAPAPKAAAQRTVPAPAAPAPKPKAVAKPKPAPVPEPVVEEDADDDQPVAAGSGLGDDLDDLLKDLDLE